MPDAEDLTVEYNTDSKELRLEEQDSTFRHYNDIRICTKYTVPEIVLDEGGVISGFNSELCLWTPRVHAYTGGNPFWELGKHFRLYTQHKMV